MADNSPFLRAQVGDILHFSKFYVPTIDSYWIRNVWAVVTHAYTGYLSVDIFTGKERGIVQADATDTGRIVKQDKVPDWVWAELAKYRLIGADVS